MIKQRRLSTEEAQEHASRAVRVLSDDPRVQLVYLFGSAAGSGRDRVRDVDLAVLTDPPMTVAELMQLRGRVVLDTGAEIDLVPLNRASVILAREVVDSGVCLFARDVDVETDFVVRTRARYLDFKPFLEEQWRLAGERLKERRRGS